MQKPASRTREAGFSRTAGDYTERNASTTLWPPNPNELLIAAIGPSGSALGLAAHDVRVDLPVELVDVDGRRGRAVVQRQDGGHRLDAARATQEVTGHRLRRGDRHVVQVLAQHLAQRLDLGDVALRRRRGVCVEVDHLGRLEVAGVQEVLHRGGDAPAGRLGLRDVVGVGRQALAQHLAVDLRTALGGVLGGLQDDDARTLAEDEPVPAGVVRTRCLLGLVVALRHRHHVGERRDRQRVDRRLRAA